MKRRSILNLDRLTQDAGKRGSALLVTILVVSLLLVIVLSMTVFVRLELRKVQLRQQHMQAKANARLAAQLAVGRLQEMAGQDQRITFPAEADATLSPDPNNRYWTGVRDNRRFIPDGSGGLVWNPNLGNLQGWLVSGNGSADPTAQYLNGTEPVQDPLAALLVGEGSVAEVADFVAVPVEELLDSNNDPVGEIAYWVSGENVKAQINLTDPFALDTLSANDDYSTFQVQRNATEIFADLMQPDNLTHWEVLGRTITPDQVDLTNLISGAGMDQFFHSVTLGAYGLPTNPKRGGLKKDLTSVLLETWDNGGVPPAPIGSNQIGNLFAHQEERIDRLREETVALNTLGAKPAGVSDKIWNAANALTLRQDQADANENTLMFPPMSDMDLRLEPGGPDWRQLLSSLSMQQHAMSGGALVPGKTTNVVSKPAPVIAKFNLSSYVTVDWPSIRLYFVPAVVLWNPYNAPLQAQTYYVTFRHNQNHFKGYNVHFHASHPSWNGGNPLWTPPYNFWYESDPSTPFAEFNFRLEATEIPAGAAVIFTMDEHQEVQILNGETYTVVESPTSGLTRNKVSDAPIDLVAGINGGGGFGLYVEEADLNQKIIWAAQTEENISNTSFWNHWDVGLWYRDPGVTNGDGGFPLYVPTDGSGNPMGPFPNHVEDAVNRSPTLDMGINVNGLDPAQNWTIEATTMSLRHPGAGKADEVLLGQATQVYLADQVGTGPNSDDYNDQPLVVIQNPLNDLPVDLNTARPEDGLFAIIPGLPPTHPASNDPFIIGSASFPGFPMWGLSWALRLPENGYSYSTTAGSGLNLGAPVQWLGQVNPASHTHGREGLGAMRNEDYDETSTRGYDNPPTYIGGFTTDFNYFDLGNTSDDDRHQFIGHSSVTPPTDFNTGDIPRAVLFDFPQSAHDITSVAGMSMANLQAMELKQFASINNESQGLVGGTALTARKYKSMHAGNWYPAYPIGNSRQPQLLRPDQAIRTYFPSGTGPSTPPISVPFFPWKAPTGDWGETGDNASPPPYARYRATYDYSWILNELLWDDFFFTSDANSRLRWEDGIVDRDFHESAERVWIEGAFNVNSTSVKAWAALLIGLIDVEIPIQDGTDTPAAETVPFNRFFEPYSENYSDINYYSDQVNFSGYRRLARDDIWDDKGTPADVNDDTGLAVEIVNQIKERGPFLSIADFVNRSLIDELSDPDDHRLQGALDAAIEAAGINDSQVDPGPAVIDQSDFNGSIHGHSHFHGHDLSAASGPANRGAAGFLMQSDVLAKIGSVLQVRSDTFKIRAYGTAGGQGGSARAWCEVWVRRTADYVDQMDTPDVSPELVGTVNQLFGRRFEIIGFRWLSREDI